MNTYANISNELKAFFSKHPVFKILLPVDVVLIFGGLGFMVLNSLFPRIGLGVGFFGGLLSSLAYWIFILGLLLAYSNSHDQFLYSGLFGYAGLQLILLFKYIKYFSPGYLVAIVIFGGLGYLVFRRSSTISATSKTNTYNTDTQNQASIPHQQAAASAASCNVCGAELKQDSMFCTNCGAKKE